MLVTNRLTHLSLVCVFAMTACFAGPALAQKDGRINSRQVTGYAELLAMDDEQTEIALLLYSDYIERIETATNARRNGIEKFMEDEKITKRSPEVAEAWFKLTQEYEREMGSAQETFFGDLRLVLDEDQARAWPRVERKRRRETTLRKGWLSGGNVDLIDMTRKFMSERPISMNMTGALDSYEIKLDRALIIKQRAMDDMLNKVANPKRSLAEEDFREMGETKQTMGLPVRDLNFRYARMIEGLMPDELAAEYHNEWLRRAFPRIYRESKTDRLFRAVGEIDDLSDEQRMTTDSLLATFTRERAAANKAITTAIIDREDNPPQDGAVKTDIGPVDAPQTPLQKAVATRQSLEERYEEKVRAVLSSEQEHNLPSLKDPKAQNQGKGGGGARDR